MTYSDQISRDKILPKANCLDPLLCVMLDKGRKSAKKTLWDSWTLCLISASIVLTSISEQQSDYFTFALT